MLINRKTIVILISLILSISIFSLSCKKFKDYVKDMKDIDPDVRVEAADFLGNSKDPRALPVLLNGINDNNMNVKIACVRAIGNLKIGSNQAAKKIIELLHKKTDGKTNKKSDNEDIELINEKKNALLISEIIKTLGVLRSRDSIQYLKVYLKSSNVIIRRNTVEAFTKIVTKEVFTELINALNDKDYKVRGYAAKALSNIGSKDAIPDLQKLLNVEENDFALERAIHALGALKDNDSIDTFKHYLKTSKSKDVKVECIYALGNLNDDSSLNDLIKVLNDESPEVREKAIWAIGKYKNKDIFSYIKDFANDDNEKVRLIAIEVLSTYIQNPSLEGILIDALDDDDENVRAKAAEGLVKIKSLSEYEPIYDAAEDKYFEVRQHAVYALGKKGNEEALSLLLEILDEDDIPIVRANAAYALGMINSYSAIPYIIKAFETDRSSHVRLQCIKALGRFPNSIGVTKYIIRALRRDESDIVRKTSADILSNFQNDTTVIRALEDALRKDVSKIVRMSAFDALKKMGYEVKGLEKYINEHKKEIDLNKPELNELDDYDQEIEDFDFLGEFIAFYFIKSPLGQFLIYLITILFIISIAYILSLIIKYVVFEQIQMIKVKSTIKKMNNNNVEIIDSLLNKISKRSIIYKRLKDMNEVNEKDGKINHSLMAELLASKEISRFRVTFIRYSTSVFVVLGLIGTFWGVSEMVVRFDHLLSQLNTDDLQNLLDSMVEAVTNMKKVLVGMQTAFSTSIFGLISTVLIGFFNFILSWIQNNFLLRLENYTQNDFLFLFEKKRF